MIDAIQNKPQERKVEPVERIFYKSIRRNGQGNGVDIPKIVVVDNKDPEGRELIPDGKAQALYDNDGKYVCNVNPTLDVRG